MDIHSKAGIPSSLITRKMSPRRRGKGRKKRTRTSRGAAYWLNLMGQPSQILSSPLGMRSPHPSQRLLNQGPPLYRRLHPLPNGALWSPGPNFRQLIPTSNPLRWPMLLRARAKKPQRLSPDCPRRRSRPSQLLQQRRPQVLISIARSRKRHQHPSRTVSGRNATAARNPVSLLSTATSPMQMTRTMYGQNVTRKTKTGTLSRPMAKNVTGRAAITYLHAGLSIDIGLLFSARVRRRTVLALARQRDYPPSMALALRAPPQRNAAGAPVPCF